ncbi:MAG: hypothetical protein GY862_39550 [Gammaproteobacteria bacterium]|nr:hypothetical protein [Gammaproteobacteria bacterium]
MERFSICPSGSIAYVDSSAAGASDGSSIACTHCTNGYEVMPNSLTSMSAGTKKTRDEGLLNAGWPA